MESLLFTYCAKYGIMVDMKSKEPLWTIEKLACKTCGLSKKKDDFRKKVKTWELYKNCMRCREDSRAFKKSKTSPAGKRHNAMRQREYNYRSKYGITMEDFLRVSREQGDACKICLKKTTRALCVDHDHETGAVRGLLCTQCNSALGMLEDSTERMERVIKYLKSSVDLRNSKFKVLDNGSDT